MISRNLLTRLISSLVLIPVVVMIIVWGGWLFGALVLAAFLITMKEWIGLCKAAPSTMLYLTIGTIYFAFSYFEYVQLRTTVDNGAYMALVCIAMVWGSDTMAYVFGKNIGGALMSPTISPRKTWAGLAGAMVGSAIVFTGMILISPHIPHLVPNKIQPDAHHILILLALGGMMGYVGQIGDLLISAVKRKANKKDSGELIPGHGGILDRLDSLLLVIPVFVVVARHIIG